MKSSVDSYANAWKRSFLVQSDVIRNLSTTLGIIIGSRTDTVSRIGVSGICIHSLFRDSVTHPIIWYLSSRGVAESCFFLSLLRGFLFVFPLFVLAPWFSDSLKETLRLSLGLSSSRSATVACPAQ